MFGDPLSGDVYGGSALEGVSGWIDEGGGYYIDEDGNYWTSESAPAGPTLIAHLAGDEANGASLLVGTGMIAKTGASAVFTEAESGYGFDCVSTAKVSIDPSNINPNRFKITFITKDSGANVSYGKFFVLDVDATCQLYRGVGANDLFLNFNNVIVWQNMSLPVDLYTSTPHTIDVTLDNDTDTVEVKIDDVVISNEVSPAWPADVSLTTGIYFGNRAAGDRTIGNLMGDIKIYSLP